MTTPPVRVLIVEDDEDDFVLVEDLLGDMEHVQVRVHWETTYEGGRAALESGDFDVCLLDYRLGARDGITLLREIRGYVPRTPIIFLTGQDSRELDIQAMEAGAADYLVKGKLDTQLLERSIRYARERARLLAELHRLSRLDDLTGLFNRRGFEEQAVREMKLADRRQKGFGLLFADVDHFKRINDEYGHAEGDRALRAVAELLSLTFRESDIIARVGGDEFVMVPIDAPASNVEYPERRLQANLDRWNADANRPYRLSLTLGMSFYDPNAPCTLEELVARADEGMYARKPRQPLEQHG